MFRFLREYMIGLPFTARSVGLPLHNPSRHTQTDTNLVGRSTHTGTGERQTRRLPMTRQIPTCPDTLQSSLTLGEVAVTPDARRVTKTSRPSLNRLFARGVRGIRRREDCGRRWKRSRRSTGTAPRRQILRGRPPCILVREGIPGEVGSGLVHGRGRPSAGVTGPLVRPVVPAYPVQPVPTDPRPY